MDEAPCDFTNKKQGRNSSPPGKLNQTLLLTNKTEETVIKKKTGQQQAT